MGKKILMKSGIKPNTFIGGVGATINTPALLATKLGIAVSRIKAFKVVGSDIECAIIGNYNIPSSAFSGNSTGITSYNDVEGKVLVLNNSSFANNTNIVSVIFPNCTTINSVNPSTRVFGGCTSLTTVTMPNVTSLGFGSFWGCVGGIAFNFPLVTSIPSMCFYGASGTFTSFDSVVSLESNAFLSCNVSGSLNFPICTTMSGVSTFNECTASSIYLPQLITISNADGRTFKKARNISSLYLPELTTWGGSYVGNTAEGTFFQCTSLTSFSAPKLTGFQMGYAFNRCSAITLINIPKCILLGVSNANNNVFFNMKSGCVINVNVALQTANDGDLVYAISARGATVNYEI